MKSKYKIGKHLDVYWGGGVVELANANAIRPRALCLNIGVDRKYFLIMFVSHLRSNLWVLFDYTHIH
jgi:hypothetical protein